MAEKSDAHYEALLEKAFYALTASDFDGVVEACEAIRAIKPDSLEALFLLGVVAYALNDYGRAIKIMEAGHQLAPECREFADFLAGVNSRVGKLAESLFYTKLAMTLESSESLRRYMPQGFDDFEKNMQRVNLPGYFIDASIYYIRRNYRKAIELCERELAINPENAACMDLLGRALGQVHEYDRAIETLIRAVELAPDNEDYWDSLGDVLLVSGRPSEAYNIYQRILDLNPNSIGARMRMAHTLAYGEDDKWSGYPQLVSDIGRLLAKLSGNEPRERPRSTDGTVHVGILINEQSIADKSEILFALFNGLDSDTYKVFAYQQYSQVHPATIRLKDSVHHWRRTHDIDNETLKVIIKNDGIDVLIDTCGLMAGHRQELLAMHPAPLQISWLGFPVGGTQATMDVLFACDQTLSVDQRDAQGVKCISLGKSLYSYPGGAVVLKQENERAPAETNGYVTFGAFIDLPRLVGSVELMANVLKSVERSQLVLGGIDDQDGLLPLVQALFEQSGVADRVSLQGTSDGLSERSHLLTEIDILLDTCYVNGTGEICDALWMGVPVVTLMGQRRSSRLGGATLQAAGFPSWVASTPDAYVEIASSLAQDAQQLSSLRSNIRSTLESSPLMDTDHFVTTMEQSIGELLGNA